MPSSKTFSTLYPRPHLLHTLLPSDFRIVISSRNTMLRASSKGGRCIKFNFEVVVEEEDTEEEEDIEEGQEEEVVVVVVVVVEEEDEEEGGEGGQVLDVNDELMSLLLKLMCFITLSEKF